MRAPTLLRLPLLIAVLAILTGPTGIGAGPAASDAPARIGPRLAARLASLGPRETAIVFVYLRDKGPGGRIELFRATDLLSPKSIARRARVNRTFGERDLPVDAGYVGQISRTVTRTRHALRWFNAVSVEATKAQIDALLRLPFVGSIELVGQWAGKPEPEERDEKGSEVPDRTSGTAAHLLDYGASITQNDQIDVPQVHDMGIYGEGVTVGVFDNGFRLLTHEAFDSMNIIATYDFVDHKVSVVPNAPQTGFGSHGVNTLSTIGGYRSGQLIGPAFRADYILARTENDSSETPIEEDNWAAGIEWADSIGVDVTSTSLGYLTYDFPYTSWTWANMDGNTTVITQACDMAAANGIVVINSAGNSGSGNGTDNTLGAPADGDSVIAAGAVTSAGVRASFSSVGPTTDVPSRIKPDVMAMGVGVRVASSTNPVQYGVSNGTSFSCPLTGGVAALILSANPGLTPMQVRDAMRNTADNAASPNNQYGWGILDADSAIGYWGIVPMASASGTIFHDVDGDGVMDPGETPLAGRSVVISGASSDTVVSGGAGQFTFSGLGIGAHELSAIVDPGWMISTPPGSLGLSLLHRDTLTGLVIGLSQTGRISGTVFNDTDRNGSMGPGEGGLGGWTVIRGGLSKDTIYTDTAGAYAFPGLLPGSYTVIVREPAGWVQTFPGDYGFQTVAVTDGLDTTGVDVGEFFADSSAHHVLAGWNMLSLPVEAAEPQADSIYPNAGSSPSMYDGGYVTSESLSVGRGYWLKFPVERNILIEGPPRTFDTIGVDAGWNMIGTLSVPVPVAAITQSPESIVVSKFYSFSGTAYEAVPADSSLLPHRGYWVKSAVSGTLILDGSVSTESDRYVWVAAFFSGGAQCDSTFYTPPDAAALLVAAGVEPVETSIEEYMVCAACGCPDYAGMHYALIRKQDLEAALGAGFMPSDPPPGS